MPTKKNDLILKNAGLLYIRLLLTMGVTLYTSRVVLNTLGIEDFGTYSVVTGLVTILGFLHGAMTSVTQRFLCIELGKQNATELKNVFSMSVNIHILAALTIFTLGESIGIWFIHTQLTIPADRMNAAEWVFHLSLISYLITVLSVPYHTAIIAHERMSVYAWTSIFDTFLKLIIVYLLQSFGQDKLTTYAALTLIVTLVVSGTYGIYSRRKFPETAFKLYWNKVLFIKMLSYAGWSTWGNLAAVMSGQGVNIILNMFFGPTVNAARAIAFQVSSALNSFMQNLQAATNPQIIKSFASDNLEYMHSLICNGAKYNFFLLLTLSLPVLIETEAILHIWLGIVPEHTIVFVRLVIINILIDSVSAPLIAGAQASGKIKLYQTIVGGLILLNLPISYALLHFGYDPEATVYASISISILSLTARLIIITPLIKLPIPNFLKKVILKSLIVSSLSITLPLFLKLALPQSAGASFVIFVASVSSCIFCVYILGLDHSEKIYINQKLKLLAAKVKK